MTEAKPKTTRGLVSWALYDWANSPFTTLIVTFVFSVYFSLGIVGGEIRATQLWGNAVSISALIIAVMAPILGAIADAGGRANRGYWFSPPCVSWDRPCCGGRAPKIALSPGR